MVKKDFLRGLIVLLAVFFLLGLVACGEPKEVSIEEAPSAPSEEAAPSAPEVKVVPTEQPTSAPEGLTPEELAALDAAEEVPEKPSVEVKAELESAPAPQQEMEPEGSEKKSKADLIFENIEGVNSFSYRYREDLYKVYGSKMKIEFYAYFNLNEVGQKGYLDTAYFDLETGKGVGYCQRTIRSNDFLCHSFEDTEFELDFKFFKEGFPHYWYNQYKSLRGSETIEKDQTLRGMKTYKVKYNDGTGDVRLWFDTYSFVPIRVRFLYDEDKEIDFHDPLVDRVKPEDVEWPDFI